MNIEEFWELINEMHERYGDDQRLSLQWLKEQLMYLPPSQVLAYHCIFHSFKDAADKKGLLSAVNFMMDSEDRNTFMNFRAWLIAQGREIYYRVLRNPDRLAEIILCRPCSFEELNRVGYDVYQNLTGRNLYHDCTPEMAAEYIRTVKRTIVYHPLIQCSLNPVKLRILFPHLYRKYAVEKRKGA